MASVLCKHCGITYTPGVNECKCPSLDSNQRTLEDAVVVLESIVREGKAPADVGQAAADALISLRKVAKHLAGVGDQGNPLPTPEQAWEAIEKFLGGAGKVFGQPWVDAQGEWHAVIIFDGYLTEMAFRIGASLETTRGQALTK